MTPECVWKHFDALTKVPRPSGHLERVQQFLLDFAAQAGVEAFKDKGNNIVMRKPATPGMETRKTVVLQAHMDMVPQKAPDSQHCFETDPIETYIDGDWIKACLLYTSGSTMIPSWLLPTPISSSAQIIPSDSTPRSLLRLMVNSLSPS